MKETISIIINFSVMCITSVYVLLTWHLLKANRGTTEMMQQQFEASIRPHIIVDANISSSLFVLRIRNLGVTAAENLFVKLNKDFYLWGSQSEEHNLAKVPAFNQSIRSFAPGAEFLFELGSVFSKYESNFAPGEFDVTCTYTFLNREIKETTHINLNMFANSSLPRNEVVQELMKIRKTLEDLTKAIQKAGVVQ